MKKIAFFGTGLLGTPMVLRLLEAGHQVVVYNRTAARAEPLGKKGAEIAVKPAEAVEKAQVLITMLTDYSAVDEVLFSRAAQKFHGKTLIQMGTISPMESLMLKHHFEEAGGEYIEAPVLGSIPQAKARTLIVLFGGILDQFKQWQSFLKVFGDRVIRMGNVGKASAAKLALNQLIASLTAAFSMSLGYCRESGVNIKRFMEILRGSALYATTFDKKLNRMLTRNFKNPNFPVKHLLKDVDLMLAEFGKKGINIEPLEGVKKILLKNMAEGNADMDYSVLYNAVHPIS
ncbi:MAG: NAD(P)-dependent oxidoreductase [Candidatus Aminicenantes bacterium]|nr:MAG: NAD(P)-dependent oxidoreductase [Candidatus Aminicenantes bacterium]